MIKAVLFDLDDTLYDQQLWLAGAWDAVSQAGGDLGLDASALRRQLDSVAAEGSARGGIIDRALERVGATVSVAPLLTAFREHRPGVLEPRAGAVAALAELRRRVLVGLVTDGDVAIQRAKLSALGLSRSFDVVVLADELGRDRRKPHPDPFLLALARLGVDPSHTVFIGDHPTKDVVGPQEVGIRAVRVLSGEYRSAPDVVRPWAVVPDLAQAIQLVARSIDEP